MVSNLLALLFYISEKTPSMFWSRSSILLFGEKKSKESCTSSSNKDSSLLRFRLLSLDDEQDYFNGDSPTVVCAKLEFSVKLERLLPLLCSVNCLAGASFSSTKRSESSSSELFIYYLYFYHWSTRFWS